MSSPEEKLFFLLATDADGQFFGDVDLDWDTFELVQAPDMSASKSSELYLYLKVIKPQRLETGITYGFTVCGVYYCSLLS